MLCQNCKKNQASFHYKSNQNGHVTEKHLCSECASKLGYAAENVFDIHSPFGAIDDFFGESADMVFGGILGNMLGTSTPSVLKKATVCPKCGMRYSDFTNSGKLGCPDCYNTFSNYLLPTINQIHGNTRHNGKMPSGISQKAASVNKLSELKASLNAAIEKQEYEQAAKIRDEIRDLEKSIKEQGNTEGDSYNEMV